MGIMRRSHLLSLFAVISIFASSGVFGAPDPPKLLQRATAIPLRTGINRLANFAGDGREALVALGWRDNGNAHGYLLYTVLMKPSEPIPGVDDWNVVGWEYGNRFADTIADEPHTGEDVVKAVRFLTVDLDKRRQTVVVVATRHWQDTIPEPAPTTIEVFALRLGQGQVGETSDYFIKILTVSAKAKYCNADMALKQEFGLPLPASYAGGRTATGC